ncbi:MAG: hypothetical protein GXZ11_01255 [Tissierellia bacterium]|nr:hypothetical protein [Tissierellia bacterium]
MTEQEFIGTLFIVGIPLVLTIILGAKALASPLKALEIAIANLNIHLDNATKANEIQDRRLDVHGKMLDNLNISVALHDKDIDDLKCRVDKR